MTFSFLKPLCASYHGSSSFEHPSNLQEISESLYSCSYLNKITASLDVAAELELLSKS